MKIEDVFIIPFDGSLAFKVFSAVLTGGVFYFTLGKVSSSDDAPLFATFVYSWRLWFAISIQYPDYFLGFIRVRMAGILMLHEVIMVVRHKGTKSEK